MYRYLRRPFSFEHEESGFHERNPQTGVIVGAEPFFSEGNTGCDAVLFLHGYTSTPRDLKGVADAVNRILGYTVYGILLPGHGTKPSDLDRVTWQDWYDAALEAYRKLRESHKVVHIVGFSMGASLALHIAANNEVGKLILLCPLFKISYNPFHLFPEEWWVKLIGSFVGHLKKRYSGNCNDKLARGRHIAYFHYSPSSTKEALLLVREIRKEIPHIENSLLMIHSRRDKTTSPYSSRRIFSRIPSKFKRFVWLDRSNHIITHDLEKDLVYKEIIKFLN